jgi:hypothetical protein
MTEFSNDDSRLRAAEEQMRRALGLRDPAPVAPAPTVARPAPNNPIAPHRPHRRFVREGEVPVEVVHHEGAGTNQLEAARQSIRTLTAAREQTERQLAEAQATIRDLQTKLAHERMARDEAVQRAATEGDDIEKALQSARAELETERSARHATEEQLAAALERCSKAERRVEQASPSGLDAEPVKLSGAGREDSSGAGREDSEVTERIVKPGRRRGRPPKAIVAEPESEFVEWWKPGWQQQFR